jgi:hypothetical protein
MNLDDVKIASPCHVEWEDMTGDDRKRFCGSCQLDVHNISDMSRKEAEKFLEQSASCGGRLCIQYYQRHDGTILTEDCPVGLRRLRDATLKLYGKVASFVSAAFCLAMPFAKAQGTDTSTPQPPPQPIRADDMRRTAGMMAPMPRNTNTTPPQPQIMRGEAVMPIPTNNVQLNVSGALVSLRQGWQRKHTDITNKALECTSAKTIQFGELEKNKNAFMKIANDAMEKKLKLEAATSYNNAGSCLMAQMKFGDAEAMYTKAINLSMENEKAPYPNTLAIAENLLIAQKMQGKPVATKGCSPKAADIVKKCPARECTSVAFIHTNNGGLTYFKPAAAAPPVVKKAGM